MPPTTDVQEALELLMNLERIAGDLDAAGVAVEIHVSTIVDVRLVLRPDAGG